MIKGYQPKPKASADNPSSHDNCIICSYDVTGADFENSLYASANQKRVTEFNV